MNLWDNFKQYLNYRGARREEEEQEIENLFEKIMKENFPSLAKEINFQEAQRVPKKLDLKRNPPRYTIIKSPKIKDNCLKAVKRKGDSYLQRSAHKVISRFLKRNVTGKKGLERSIQSHQKEGPTSKKTRSSKAIL